MKPITEVPAVKGSFGLSPLSLVCMAALGTLVMLGAIAGAAPSVGINSPANLATIASGTIPLEVSINGFTLDCANIGRANAAGTGHYHILLDGLYQKFDCRPTSWLANVPEGAHAIRIELANNDHSLLGINGTVNVTIAPGSPRLWLRDPVATGGPVTVNSSSLRFQLAFENFSLSEAQMGGTNFAGVGHIHVILDDATTIKMTAATTINISNLAAGATYKFTFELHQNDHTLAIPATFDSIWVTIRAGRPSITVLDPVGGSTVALNWTSVTVNVTNFTLDPAAIGSPAFPGRGHFHLFIDDVYKAMAGTSTTALVDLVPGSHLIRVELYNNNHVALPSPVWDEVRVTVIGAKPSLQLVAPVSDFIVWGNSTNVTVAVSNFALDPDAIGGAAVNGRGHIHVYVDDVYKSATASLTVVVTNLAVGDHRIKVTLNNNDHTPLGVPQEVSVLVYVAAVPSFTIASPTNGFRTHNHEVNITLVVADFVIDAAAYNQASVAGRGHFHIFVDTVYAGPALNTTFKVGNLSVGNHSISVRAFTNNHTEIPGSTAAVVQIDVTAPPAQKGFLPAPGLPETLVGLALAAAGAGMASRRRRTASP